MIQDKLHRIFITVQSLLQLYLFHRQVQAQLYKIPFLYIKMFYLLIFFFFFLYYYIFFFFIILFDSFFF